ncbi:MAG: T9SS type A sorting domain-containing protein [Saprospiraceae bacterium]
MAICSSASPPPGGNGNYTYDWGSSPAGFSSNLQNPDATPTSSITYIVTVSDGANSATASVAVTVHPPPLADAGDDPNIIEGQSTTLTASGGTGFQWSTGATTASVAVSPKVSLSANADRTAFCAGGHAQLSALAANGTGSYTYDWTSEPVGFISALPDPFVNPEETTTYTVLISDGVNGITRSLQITVNPLPAQPLISVAGGTLTSSSASNNQWFYYGNPIPSATGQAFTPTQTGSYQVQIVDANGCFSPLSEPVEVIIVSAGQILDGDKWTLAPNPASEVLRLLGDFGGQTFSVEIRTLAGQTLLRQSDTREIPVADLAPGIYWVRLETAAGSGVKKVAVVR